MVFKRVNGKFDLHDVKDEFIRFLDRTTDGILNILPAQVLVMYLFLMLGDPFNKSSGTRLQWTRNVAVMVVGVYAFQRIHDHFKHGDKTPEFSPDVDV